METSYPNPSFKTISKWVNVKKEGSFGFANMAVFTNYQLPIAEEGVYNEPAMV